MTKRPSMPHSSDKPRFVPPHFSPDELQKIELSRTTISAFLSWAARVPVGRKDLIRDKIAKVASDHSLVIGLCEELLALDGADPVRHFMLLSTIGETRNSTAVPALKKLIWLEQTTKPIESSPNDTADVSEIDFLTSLQARAVEMLAYIGGESAYEVVFDVAARHSAIPVRIAAIDAYLFNHQDSKSAKDRLQGIVKPSDAKFIGLPRFSRNSDQRDFEKRVEEFYLANPDQRPPVPSTVPPQGRSDSSRADLDRPKSRRLL